MKQFFTIWYGKTVVRPLESSRCAQSRGMHPRRDRNNASIRHAQNLPYQPMPDAYLSNVPVAPSLSI